MNRATKFLYQSGVTSSLPGVRLDLGSKITKFRLGDGDLKKIPTQFLESDTDSTRWIKPIYKGQVWEKSDLDSFLKQKIQPLIGKSSQLLPLTKTDFKCIIPSSSSAVEKKIFQRSLNALGIGNWKVITKKDNYNLEKVGGIIDLGFQTTEVILSDGQKKVAKTLWWGSQNLLARVREFIKQEYELEIDDQTVVSILNEIQDENFWQPEASLTQKINLRGKNLKSFTPETKTIDVAKLQSVIWAGLDEVIEEVMLFLSRVDTALVAKVLAQKMILTGGLSGLSNLNQYWSEKFKAEFKHKNYVYF